MMYHSRVHIIVSRLEVMEQSEIQGYSDALASSLTKPIRKLNEESRYHFGKIRRYAPEVLKSSESSDLELGWDNPQVIANALQGLNRDHLLQVFDDLILKKETRARIVSTVYGKTFPMPTQLSTSGTSSSVLSLEDLLAKRNKLIPFDPTTNYSRQHSFASLIWINMSKHKAAYVAAVAAIGVGAWAIGCRSNSNGKKQMK